MAKTPYEGHTAQSVSKARAVADADSNLAPADRNNYNPKDAQWETFPGAAARAAGYPRDDGGSK